MILKNLGITLKQEKFLSNSKFLLESVKLKYPNQIDNNKGIWELKILKIALNK